MATENNSGVVNGHSKQEPLDANGYSPEPTIRTEAEVNDISMEDTARETKGDCRPQESDQGLPAESVSNPNQISSEGTRSAEDFKPIDPSTSLEQALAGAVTDTQPPSTAETAQAGDKQEHNSSSTPTHDDKANTGESTEPARKKQKIGEENGMAKNGQTAGPATDNSTSNVTGNDEKKSGRSKKVKDTAKRTVHSDGIGSRTRSRTKAAAT
ncbi:hypothetical protein KXW98_006927 [Aspergillus fumigatus]|nr:hypothetical protein CNMCM8057_000763 [Aspergillus fumigatus]KAF4277106.1 hypothetical protein CNMCM8689_005005 [Aspergillus fumigatus]KAF4294974.1 hypothetical protein CNMCM8686_001501 [Aspergillus fumigatus]KAH1271817.1 hypothetical protein KXX30_005638 [Aspergillus fumigatus]KAH1286552.1 hypothetical protein KXX48_000365 [Aspergillus fumigatus]